MKRYPSWWPAVFWLGVCAAASLVVFAPAIMAAPVRPAVVSRPAVRPSAPPKVRKAPAAAPVAVPAAAPVRCERDSFGRCVS